MGRACPSIFANADAVIAVAPIAFASAIVTKLRALEQRKATLRVQLDSVQPVPRLPEHIVQNHLNQWRRLLRGSITQGRAVLQRVIQGRITFTPTQAVVHCGDEIIFGQPGYDFHAPTRFDKLFAGHTIRRPAVAPYDGPVPEYTFAEDADYGALLARAYGNGKGLASPTGIEPSECLPIHGVSDLRAA